MGEPASLDDSEYAHAIDTAVAVVEAVRNDWSPPSLTEHDQFLLALVVEQLHTSRDSLLDACAIIAAAVEALRRQQATGNLERVTAVQTALENLVRPHRLRVVR